MEVYAAIFQWFVLLSATGLAILVIARFVSSLRRPVMDAAAGSALAGADARTSNATSVFPISRDNSRLFFSLGRPVFFRILAAVAISRALLYGVAFLSARIYMDYEGGFFESITALWQRSDAMHYISIANEGYVSVGEDRVFLVFLPFFPLLVKLLSFVFQSTLVSGMFISHISFLGSCVLAYEVAILMGYDEEAAYSVPVFMCLFPASFFINGTFNEGLFLLLSAFFFHLLLRKKWVAASIFGLLAAFTRYYGVLLFIPYGIELAQSIAHDLTVGNKENRIDSKKAFVNSASILLIPVGTVLFLCVNYAVSGNFFQFLIHQRDHWNQELGFFFDNMKGLAINSITFDPPTSASRFIPQVFFIILTVVLMIFGARAKFRLSWLAFIGANFILTISASWLLSFERYMFGVYPIFFLMASLGQRSRFAASLIKWISAAGLFFLAIAYTCGKHVY